MYNLLAVGADPEFFLADKNNTPVPAIGLIGGTKAKPRFINKDGFSAVQEDNVMVEYNIKPAQTADEFVRNNLVVLAYLDRLIKSKKLVPLVKASAEFPLKVLEHPQAQEIGCSVDYSAWTKQMNIPASAEKLGKVRTSGGHIHISYTWNKMQPSPDDQIQVVRMCDLALGIPSVILDPDKVRREFYGLAGCFRPKNHGVEYRSLSNFWLTDPKLMSWVFNQVIWAFNNLKNHKYIDSLDEMAIQTVINKGNKQMAEAIIEKYRIAMPQVNNNVVV